MVRAPRPARSSSSCCSDLASSLGKVGAEERLAASQHHGEVLRNLFCGDGFQRTDEIVNGHIALASRLFAVASAMAAVQVAARGAFPKQVVQFVNVCFKFSKGSKQQIVNHLRSRMTVNVELLISE